MKVNFSDRDLEQITSKGIPLERIQHQLRTFELGILPAKLNRPCTVGDGIIALYDDEQRKYLKLHASAAAEGRLMKFIPASGAATRMFKALLAIYAKDGAITLDSLAAEAEKGDSDAGAALKFFQEIDRFAFFPALQEICPEAGNETNTLTKGDLRSTLEYLLTVKGLNYGSLPKGIILFHRYKDRSRTAFQEHIAEAIAYTLDRNRRARIHFTAAAERLPAIKAHIESYCQTLVGSGAASSIEVSFSPQKSSTDTIAVDMENRPFRDEEGRLLFRPGGHGALLENITELEADIVFIKNVDNVVPDRLKPITCQYKKVLCGYLVELQEKTFGYLKALETGTVSSEAIGEIAGFAARELSSGLPDNFTRRTETEQIKILRNRLNRPLRICGMVRNVGEPGGGPFWIEGKDGSLSLQIVEISQIDLESPEQRAMLECCTHFNPVDLVCGLRDYQGKPFNLADFTDPETGFITKKSWGGVNLKALELPGLWNGAMAGWNTVFVEVPTITFNPVKTVNDLLRPEHQ